MESSALAAFWMEFNRLYNENGQLYHRMARACGMSDCAFWLLYTLRAEEAPMTQTQLSELLSLPRQTVNSALKNLVGDELLRRTVDLVFGVEDAAASHLTAEERATLLALGQKLLDACRAETENFLQTTSIGD